MRQGVDKAEREIWKERLADLGIRSVNALVEMGDLDAARRQLESLKGPGTEGDIDKLRKALLYLRIGDVGSAKEILNESSQLGEGILKPLLAMAEGRYDEAAAGWRGLLEKTFNRTNESMIAQNLAVCLLYTGQLNEVWLLWIGCEQSAISVQKTNLSTTVSCASRVPRICQ